MTHPAIQIPITDLIAGLQAEADQGYVRINQQGPLRLYTYTEQATWESHWNPLTRAARGLILDIETQRLVALPFPKFFNLQQQIDPIPELPFTAYEKMDGSLIICWYYNGSWHTSTKGSFNSPQAILAQELLQQQGDIEVLNPQNTYLFELIGPSNKIVIPYLDDDLILLGGYNTNTGKELSKNEFSRVSFYGTFLTPKIYPYNSLSDMVRDAESLDRNSEGFVVRFDDGTRIKIKGSEYLAVHRLISQLSPLSLWAIMKDTPDQLDALRRELPEELWADFDDIKYLLQYRLDLIYAELEILNEKTKYLSDKELGLSLPTLDPTLRKFIFPFRKGEALQGRFRQSIFQHIRPTGNALEGYRASSSMNRISGELL